MIYGENNEVYFDKLKGICGLSEKIDQGKSSFIDILMLSIYGKCPRTNDIYKLIHKGKKSGTTEISGRTSDALEVTASATLRVMGP